MRYPSNRGPVRGIVGADIVAATTPEMTAPTVRSKTMLMANAVRLLIGDCESVVLRRFAGEL